MGWRHQVDTDGFGLLDVSVNEIEIDGEPGLHLRVGDGWAVLVEALLAWAIFSWAWRCVR